MNFDSDIKSPIKDAIVAIQSYKVSNHATKISDEFYKARMLIVLKERLCGDKTLKEVASILSVTTERVRQIEALILRILTCKMKGYR